MIRTLENSVNRNATNVATVAARMKKKIHQIKIKKASYDLEKLTNRMDSQSTSPRRIYNSDIVSLCDIEGIGVAFIIMEC